MAWDLHEAVWSSAFSRKLENANQVCTLLSLGTSLFDITLQKQMSMGSVRQEKLDHSKLDTTLSTNDTTGQMNGIGMDGWDHPGKYWLVNRTSGSSSYTHLLGQPARILWMHAWSLIRLGLKVKSAILRCTLLPL